MHVLADRLKSVVLALHVHVSNVCVLFNQHHSTAQFLLHPDKIYTKVHKLVQLVAPQLIHGLLLPE